VTYAEPEAPDAIKVETRSLLGMLYSLSQSVEVPERDREKGKVMITRDESGMPFDWKEVLGDALQIKYQLIRPAEAAVAVSYRGYWFYVDDSDLESKSTFSLVSQIFALQAGKIEGVVPVLTLPVGR
jgi:hypothetical protein